LIFRIRLFFPTLIFLKMSRLLLKQLNIVERRTLSSSVLTKRALTTTTVRMSQTSAAATRRLTVTKNWLSPAINAKKVCVQVECPFFFISFILK
jgi:hypothetical protein